MKVLVVCMAVVVALSLVASAEENSYCCDEFKAFAQEYGPTGRLTTSNAFFAHLAGLMFAGIGVLPPHSMIQTDQDSG